MLVETRGTMQLTRIFLQIKGLVRTLRISILGVRDSWYTRNLKVLI